MKQYKCLKCGVIYEMNDCLRPTVCIAASAEHRISGICSICGCGEFEEIPLPDQPEPSVPDLNKWFAEELERRWGNLISATPYLRNPSLWRRLQFVKSELLKEGGK